MIKINLMFITFNNLKIINILCVHLLQLEQYLFFLGYKVVIY